jgi:hypothetical protein
MIVTERFVYIHLHRTGGSFLNECLIHFFPGARQIGYHLPRRMLPREYLDFPVIGFVRNPWDYYVSWYHFQKSRPVPNALFECASDRGRLDFRGTVANLLNLGAESETLDRLLPLLNEGYVNYGLNVPRAQMEAIRGSGLGFFSFLYRYMYLGLGGPLHVGHSENLRQDFLDLLAKIGDRASEGAQQFILEQSRRNASEHTSYASYYDDELRELVATRDRELIESYDYRFESVTPAGMA